MYASGSAQELPREGDRVWSVRSVYTPLLSEPTPLLSSHTAFLGEHTALFE